MATPRASRVNWYVEDAAQLDTSDAEVWEDQYPTHSKLLGPDGKPIPYASPKLGFCGYVRLK